MAKGIRCQVVLRRRRNEQWTLFIRLTKSGFSTFNANSTRGVGPTLTMRGGTCGTGHPATKPPPCMETGREQSRRALIGGGQGDCQTHRDAHRRRTLPHHNTDDAAGWQLSPASGTTRHDSETRQAGPIPTAGCADSAGSRRSSCAPATAGADLRGGVPDRLVWLPPKTGLSRCFGAYPQRDPTDRAEDRNRLAPSTLSMGH